MSDVAIQSYIGREFSIPFVASQDGLVVKNVTLKQGLNLIAGEIWDMIKNHPSIKVLMDTDHTSYLARVQQADGDNRYAMIKSTYNSADSGKKKKMIEVVDYRKTKSKE